VTRDARRPDTALPSCIKSPGQRRSVRRALIIAGAALAIAPHCVVAQQKAKVWRIGFLGTGTRSSLAGGDVVFLETMRDLGYVEGKQFVMEWRFAEGKEDQLPVLASDLVQAKVDVIVAVSSFSVEAARKATSTIPIVMTGVGNPVASGFVSSLAHPAGNITGISNLSVVVSSKYLELLYAAVPKLTRVAVLVNPSHPNHPTVLAQIRESARTMGVSILPFDLRSADDIGRTIDVVVRDNAGALIVPPDPFFNSQMNKIVELAAKNRLPTIFGLRNGSTAGGLMSYEPNPAEMYARPAALVDKILKGAKPADLPVEQPTRFEFVINMKTAKALGLTIPPSLLLRADEVIQ
jgi:ABC-type uncharacterized transport system substrate-binding protein